VIISDRVRANLDAVQARVDDACRRAGRDPAGVRIVGVTKYVSAELAAMLLEAGCVDLAESRPQSLWEKAESLGHAVPPPRWHLVGHLQRNKVRRTLPLVALVHSLDSRRLLETIAAEAAALGIIARVLVEVNLTGDPGRTGAAPREVAALVEAAAVHPSVSVCGLMGMAAAPAGPDASDVARRQFASLRELRDRLARDLACTGLGELSMGMSEDFEEAILEGATLVRIGSLLWDGLR
jgi:pyridoxal phosphate enzyme (YggS family)